MKKIILIASVLLILALLISCDMMDNGDQEMVDDGTQASVKMTSLIKNIGNGIEVEVIEGDYEASGVYYVHISSDTIIDITSMVSVTPIPALWRVPKSLGMLSPFCERGKKQPADTILLPFIIIAPS